eukprot:3927310-Rhodomonas_salina.1
MILLETGARCALACGWHGMSCVICRGWLLSARVWVRRAREWYSSADLENSVVGAQKFVPRSEKGRNFAIGSRGWLKVDVQTGVSTPSKRSKAVEFRQIVDEQACVTRAYAALDASRKAAQSRAMASATQDRRADDSAENASERGGSAARSRGRGRRAGEAK